ncbi:MAG: tRNA 2-thiouridine(34) synthase MnmA, partial [Anaerolineae bacterium]|nr:tRNA 2-thiouridine(34) synthase MnmA [Anaerolineae bacterium]
MSHREDKLDPRHVVVGLSGGVDSAVAAFLLLKAGYVVHAVALDTWHATRGTCQADDRADQIAAELGIPLVHRDLKATFYEKVVTPFLDAYTSGQTPNPCVFCNPALKFATLLEEADAVGALWIATGHYARVVRPPASSYSQDAPSRLFRCRAQAKDQSYALYRLTQPILRRLRLPLGEVASKDEVRDIARQCGLSNAASEESQDLCFAVGTSYQALISQLRPEALEPGPILDEAGRQLGKHKGLPLYTVGQRSGLGIAAPERLYVLRLDPDGNAVVVGPRASLAQKGCMIQQVTFIAGHPPALMPP